MEPQTCTCHWRAPEKCEVDHHRVAAAMGHDVYANRNATSEYKPLTDDDVDAMCALLRSAATMSIINTPAELVEFFVTNVAGVYDEQEQHHTNEEWAALSDAAKDKLSFKALVQTLLEFPGTQESPKRAAVSLARIYLDEDEQRALAAGDDPIKSKMKRIRTRRP